MIYVKDLKKDFGELHVLKGVNQHIAKGEKVVVIGPSGSGKSTFLRCLNLLETPTSGQITFEGVDITSRKCNINAIRQKMGIPRGERYEFCRSVHAEMNAIIAAPRDQMIGATLYLVGRDMSTGKIMSDANSCTMCKRLIINAGIEKVVIRRDVDTYDTVNVHDWVENDDTLGSSMAY